MKHPHPCEYELKYQEEHSHCRIYAPDEKAILHVFEEPMNQSVIRHELQHHVLAFVLEGTLRFVTPSHEMKDIDSGNFFLMPAGCDFYARSLSDVKVVVCTLDNNLSLCNEYTLQHLCEEVGGEFAGKNVPDHFFLPIQPLLSSELETCIEIIRKKAMCLHYQKCKRDIFLMMLRFFYTKKQLFMLFSPILGNDFAFKTRFLELYNTVKNVKEMALCFEMSPRSFNRKYQSVFHMSAGKWIMNRKKMDLFNELRLTDIPLKDLAEKYEFTPNYMASFCKEHYGMSPTEVRECGKEINN